jgi:anaerobic magnesium-protoporphyrin IX monomethyl ester cyclase
MNVLLLNPPFHPKYSRSQRSPAVIKSGVIYYPIWLAYAAGVLEKNNFDVRLIDAPAEGYDLEVVIKLALAFKPRLIVIDTSTPSIHADLQTAAALKDRLQEAFILLVGPHVTALPEATLQSSYAIDAVARGEYDYTVRDVAQHLDGGNDLSAVEGISYRESDGSIAHNADRPFIQDLDELPFVSEVYKRHLHIENYFYSITRYPEVATVTARGCPFQCTYCLWPQTVTGHAYRRRSTTNIADEFDFIARELPQVKEVFLEDDTLTVDEKRSIELAKELKLRHNRLPFSANSRANVSYETLRWLKEAGLRLLCVGFESGDQSILDAIHKRITLEQFYAFRESAKRAKVLIHGCFMAGNPGETYASLSKTLKLAKSLDPDTAQFFPLMVYPGTEAYEWAASNGYLTTNDFQEWLTPTGLHRSLVTQPGLSADDLTDWCNQARRSFYLRPRYIVNKILESLFQPEERYRLIRAARIFLRYLFRTDIP